jgi:NodT family efflux transporter outer membrane factor (OMF) lipoprotein
MPRQTFPVASASRRAGVLAAAAAASLALAACAGLPPKAPLAPVGAVDRYATQQAFAAPAAQWPAAGWWSTYGDAQLDALMDEALAGSPTIATAQARLARAQSVVQETHAAELPQVAADASITTQRQSSEYLSPKAVTPQGWHGYGRATIDFAWELDLWGRNRAALAAATSEAEAAQADLAQARLVLAAAIASAYAELAREFAALDTADEALRVRTDTVRLFRERQANGLESAGGVRQVEARRALAEADVLTAREQIALQRHFIAALAGAGPDRGLALARPAVDLARPFGLPAALPADLLGRRPDIAAARLRVEASARRIDQARAAFYPDVNLLAFIGVQSLGLQHLADSDAVIGSAGPAISLPLFDGGRLRGQLHGAEADYAAAVASYDATLQQALREVADVAASERALGDELARTTEGVDAARAAWRIQNDRYEGGLSTYLDVLSAEDGWLQDRRAQTDLQSRAFALDVALMRALGGGYVVPPAAPRS